LRNSFLRRDFALTPPFESDLLNEPPTSFVERFERRPKKFALFVARRRFVRRLRAFRDEIERRRIDGAAGRSGPALPRELVFFASVGR